MFWVVLLGFCLDSFGGLTLFSVWLGLGFGGFSVCILTVWDWFVYVVDLLCVGFEWVWCLGGFELVACDLLILFFDFLLFRAKLYRLFCL